MKKKVLVIGLVGLAIGLLFFVDAVKFQSRSMPSYAMSADSLAGDDEPSPREGKRDRAEKRRMKGEEGQMGKKGLMKIIGSASREAEEMKDSPMAAAEGFGGLGLSGSGPGGGGIGDAIGIGGLGTRGRGGGTGGYGSGVGSLAGKAERGPSKPRAPAKGGAKEAEDPAEGGGGEEAATRAWFPETFLFEPAVVTDAQGHANVPVKVPDRLTTWRVLALAHSRQGGQAGAVASFLGTLPTYVDPVVPAFLYAGDSVRLPIQVVNTTEAAISSPVRYESAGATLSATGGTVTVPAWGNTVDYVTLSTTRPGTAQVKAVLGGTDAVVRSIEVKPPGRREQVNKGGSLAAPRTFPLAGPEDAIAGSESVTLQVYPGALGFLRTELSAAPGRGGVAEDGYLLQLLGKAPALLRSLGADPAQDVMRDLTILATQRVMRHARAPSTDAATLLAEAALAHPDNAILSRLGERLAGQLGRDQRPDGSCQGADGWTLQRLQVTTAECVRAVRSSTATPASKQRALGVTIKASGFFERNVARVTEGYTAAAILASGGVEGEVAKRLKAMVLAGLESTEDGAKYLKVESGVVRADGAVPSTWEATALAVLALTGDDKAPLADLGSYLLGGYSMYAGWGDGRANLVCLRAVTSLFKDPLPSSVHLVLQRDGKTLAEGTLDAAKLREVVTLDADAVGSAGKHTWTVKAEPPVPGLGYSLSLVAFVPWKDQPGGGLELGTTLPASFKVGASSDVELSVAAPSNVATQLTVGLPAGFQTDGPALDAMVSNGQVQRYETEDGAVTLHLPGLNAGATHALKLRVVPTLAGSLQAGASKLQPEGAPGQARFFAPKTWTVK